MKYLYAFTCVAVIAALVLLVTYGTLSPCEIAKRQMRTHILAKAVSGEDTFTAVLGTAFSDSLAEAYLNQFLEGDVRPLKCAKIIFKIETSPTKVKASPAPVKASSQQTLPDPVIAAARLCTQRFPAVEQQYEIPPHLLAAVAAVESGKYFSELELWLPWPWTISVHGEKHFLPNKEEAISAVSQLLDSGESEIYVGCMQVNIAQRPKGRPNDIAAALDPETNVLWSARLLRAQYDRTKDWMKAVGNYDSRTGLKGKAYLKRVAQEYDRITVRVNKSRTNQNQ